MKRLSVILTVLAVPTAALAQGAPPPAPAPYPAPAPAPAPAPYPAPAPAPAPAPYPAPMPGAAPAAQPMPMGTAAATPTTSPPGTIWFGGGVQFLTAGNLTVSAMGMSQSGDLDTAYGFDATIDYQVSDVITLRAMPRYVIHIIPSGATGDTASMYDLRAGLTLGKEVAPMVRLYGLGAAGYSDITFPSSAGTNTPDANGLTITIGGGLAYAFSPSARFYAELGYEFGFQSVSEMGQSVDVHAKYLDLGVGVQGAIGH